MSETQGICEPLQKIVVIVGPTNVGKTKLGIELCKKLHNKNLQNRGEVINADSMQLYKDLAISTNQVTINETQGIPHHLIAFLDNFDVDFDVRKFRDLVLPLIQDIFSRGNYPVIVGGTSYYISSLLFNTLMDDHQNPSEKKHNEPSTSTSTSGEKKKEKDNEINDSSEKSDSIQSEQMNEANLEYDNFVKNENPYSVLQRVDPIMATRLHPSDTRKIKRSLEVFLWAGVPHSEILLKQQQNGIESRFDALIFWVDCERETLCDRVNNRVDEMVQRGLVDEVLTFWRKFFDSKISQTITTTTTITVGETQVGENLFDFENIDVACSKGAFQAIGVKEFLPFAQKLFNAQKENPLIDFHSDPSLQNCLQECVSLVKQHTRRYALQQKKWLSKFSRFENGNRVRIHHLDSTNLDYWNQNVLQKAEEICDEFFKGSDSSSKTLSMSTIPSLLTWKKFVCDVCDKTLNGEHEWNAHQKSKKHKSKKKGKKRKTLDLEEKANLNTIDTLTPNES